MGNGHQRLRIIAAIIYVILIFLVSSIPSLTAPGPKFLLKDKVAHLVEYMILGVLLFKAIEWSVSRARLVTFGFLLIVGSSVGALDEVLQSYVPGREMDALDWLADSLGVALGCGVFVFTALGRRRLIETERIGRG